MRRSSRRAGARREVLGFWALVALVALVLGAGGFAAGKYLIGGMIKRSTVDQGAPEIVVQDPKSETGKPEDTAAPPPRKAVVKVEERAPTEAEKAELEASRPQDGAQLNQEGEGAVTPDESTGPDTKPLTDGATNDSAAKTGRGVPGAYSVVAGSFADPANAEQEMARLSAQGYKPYVVKVRRDGKAFSRVCVGSFASQREAVRLRDKLNEEGAQAAVTRE